MHKNFSACKELGSHKISDIDVGIEYLYDIFIITSGGSRGGSGGSLEPPYPPQFFKYSMKMK